VLKRLAAATIVMTTTATASYGQSVTFQDGVTPLPGGGFYDGTIDTEFRAANPTTAQGDNPSISVDDFDGGFQTQAAIRFENLLISEGGALPDQVATGDFQIVFAELALWKYSPTTSGANITFNRVLGPDLDRREGSGPWGLDDTWSSLGGDLIPDQGGFLDGDPILEDDMEAASVPDFQDGFPAGDFTQPRDVELYATNNDSQDLLSLFLGQGLSQQDAIAQSYFRYDVTDAVTDWVVNGQTNLGWSINNDTGDGWDIASSDEARGGITQAGVAFDGVNGPAVETLRPALTVIFSAPGGRGDLDFDGDVDTDDYQLLLDNLAVELDGPITTGATGDLDFDRDVDLADFAIFKSEFDAVNGSGAFAMAVAVPEPAGLLLVALGGLVGGLQRRR